jgi:hypothetical protein
VFLAKRGKNAKNERGHWENPGGSVNYGETLEHAVKREMKEEYGVEIEIISQFPAADHLIPADNQHWVATTFLARIKPGQTPQIMEPTKCDAIGWFPLGKLPSPLSRITKMDIMHYRKDMRKKWKFYVYCPDDPAIINHIIDEASALGAGVYGNYSHSTFITRGKGNWKSEIGAHPYEGNVGEVTRTDVAKIEMTCLRKDIQKIAQAIKKVHPWEQVDIDFFQIIEI